MTQRLAAILAADVVGYSRMMGEDASAALAALRQLRRELFEPVVERHGGAVIKRMGDGWLVEFTAIAGAVDCAIEVQELLHAHELIKLRMGIHFGDIVHEDEDIYGDGVNIASRLQEHSVPGGILISADVRRQLDGTRKRDFAVIGELALKNIVEPVAAALWPASAADEHFAPVQRGALAAGSKPTVTVDAFTGRGDDEAVLAARRALEMNPNYSHGCTALANAQALMGDYGEAAVHFVQADGLMPGLPQKLMGMAASYWQAGDEDNAKRVCLRLQEVAPDICIGNIFIPPFRDKEVADRYRDSLIAGGLPD